MNKTKILFFALALSFSCGMLRTLPANATDETVNGEITVTGDEDPSTGNNETYSEDTTTITTDQPEQTQSTDEDCDETTDENCQDTPERYDADLENALDEGLADEPEVICATGDEEGCNDEANSEMWPLYISLGALATTIILVIIINLFGRKKQ